jgi:hypothetical protein
MLNAKTYIEISSLVMKSAGRLDDRLAELLKTKAGETIFGDHVDIYAVHNNNGFCGYNYWIDGSIVGQLHLATLTSGYFVIYKKIYSENEVNEIYDYYNKEGVYAYSSETLDGNPYQYNSINMDPISSFTNHIYNILYAEYDQAHTGMSETSRIKFLEDMLNGFLNNPAIEIGADKRRRDPALLNIVSEIHRVENDSVLKWNERQEIFKNLKVIRDKIVKTKSRVHHFDPLRYNVAIRLSDSKVKMELIKNRPMSNISGLMYKYTLGNLLWFLETVRSNLGYSIALAIYGPFTFYFITQPMNPHAMWAVGKVRDAYISTIKYLETGEDKKLSNIIKDKMHANASSDEVQDEVKDEISTTQAAPLRKNLKAISWDERMSHFKAMQIAYEGNMVFAERMGRIEQMENQFMFPLTAEAAWNEIERYERSVKGKLQFYKNLDDRFKNFLRKELMRAQNHQVYIWTKLGQFFRDHPYIMVDQSDEQSQRDYYVGRAFVFMKRMTDKLKKLELGNPLTHEKVQTLAARYEKIHKQGDSVMESLKMNSKLFTQNNFYDTSELRSYMKRHWEVLFIQQNKKQEASSFSLQAYTWSIKNAIWILQSLYSTKRDEIETLAYKFNLDNSNTDSVKADHLTSIHYESLMNMLTLEFVSIKEEIEKNLKNDNEAQLRITLINQVKDFLNERDKLFNTKLQMAQTDSSASERI